MQAEQPMYYVDEAGADALADVTLDASTRAAIQIVTTQVLVTEVFGAQNFSEDNDFGMAQGWEVLNQMRPEHIPWACDAVVTYLGDKGMDPQLAEEFAYLSLRGLFRDTEDHQHALEAYKEQRRLRLSYSTVQTLAEMMHALPEFPDMAAFTQWFTDRQQDVVEQGSLDELFSAEGVEHASALTVYDAQTGAHGIVPISADAPLGAIYVSTHLTPDSQARVMQKIEERATGRVERAMNDSIGG